MFISLIYKLDDKIIWIDAKYIYNYITIDFINNLIKNFIIIEFLHIVRENRFLYFHIVANVVNIIYKYNFIQYEEKEIIDRINKNIKNKNIFRGSEFC